MGVRGEALQRVKRPFPEGMGDSLLAVISTRRPSQDSVSANAELMRWIRIRLRPFPWSTKTPCRQSRCSAGSQRACEQ